MVLIQIINQKHIKKRNYTELKGNIIIYLYNDEEEYKIPNFMPLLKIK